MDSDGANVTPVCPDVLVRPTRARWSPDGLCLAVVEDLHVGGGEDKALIEATKDKRDGIALVVPPDGEPKIIFEATDIGGTCWSPDGKALALVRGGVTDDVVVIDRGGAVLCQQDMGTGVAEIDWSPDGHWLYYDRQGIGSTPRAGMLELLTVTAPVEIDGYTVRGTGERVVTAAEAATEVFFQPTHNDRALRFSPYGGAAVYQCDAAGWSNDELRVAVGALPFTPLCMTRGKPATNITNQSAEDEMPCWGR
jgi:dipeptidyl aminopeptidase/acylaminoacyl peptidase